MTRFLKLLLLIICVSFLVKKSQRYTTKSELVNLYTPAEKSVYTAWCEYLSALGIKFPKVVAAQLVLETGYFSSKIFKENHNGFGMKMHKRGRAKGVKNGHAYYDSFKDSILDYRTYQQMILAKAKEQGYKINSEEDYLWLLDNLPHCRNCRYAEDISYTKKLREHMRLLQAL